MKILSLIKTYAFENQKLKKIYILNNNSCDMDSFICSVILSICKNISENIIRAENNSDSSDLNINNESDLIYLPLMNCKRGELKTRLDINFIMKKFDINEDDLFYINDESVINDLHIDSFSNSFLILVDHNVLDPSQSTFSDRVVEIYDHHLDNSLINTNNVYKNLVKKNIVFPLGSCSTLILLDNFIIDQSYNKILFKIFDPLFLISAILLDTDNFKEELYENRWVNLDFYVYNKVVDDDFQSGESVSDVVKEFYKKLSNAKFDEEMNLSLGVEILMNKDKKSFKWGGLICEWSSLQVPLKLITNKFGWESVINYFENCKLMKENISTISLYITLSKYMKNKEGVKILTVYDYDKKIDFGNFINFCENEFGDKMKNVKYKKNVDVKFNKDKNIEKKIIKIYLDKTYSRKLLEPIMSNYFEKLNW